MLRIKEKSGSYRNITNTKEKTCIMDTYGILYKQVVLTDDIIDVIKNGYNVPYHDIIKIDNNTENYSVLRDKFNKEHFHTDYEMRLFTLGEAMFIINIDGIICELTVESGDLISIPANVNHWFDAGEEPNFAAVRFFTDSTGWEANYIKK